MDKYLVRLPRPSLELVATPVSTPKTDLAAPTVVELFAGAGGMALGLEAAGFEHVAMIERDLEAVRTLRRNGYGKIAKRADARYVDFKQWMGVDLVAGGPPCQPFSVGGVDGGDDDPRDGWPTAARAVSEIRPRAFVFENVAGLARDKFSAYLASVVKRFSSLGYTVSVHAVDAADYGVPQHRKRLFIVGFRDEGCTFAKPLPTTKYFRVTVADVFASLGPPNGQNGHVQHKSTPRSYPGHTGSTLDKPAKTLIAGCNGPSGGSTMVTLADGTKRYFTLREQARLQSFPDYYKLHAVWSHGTKQIGNACPVLLAKAFGCAILAAFKRPPAPDDSDLEEL